MSSGKGLQGVGLGEAMGGQGGSAGAATAAGGGTSRSLHRHMCCTGWMPGFGVLSKAVLNESTHQCKNTNGDRIIMPVSLQWEKKFTIPNPYLGLKEGQTVMKLLFFIHSGLKQHEHQAAGVITASYSNSHRLHLGTHSTTGKTCLCKGNSGKKRSLCFLDINEKDLALTESN